MISPEFMESLKLTIILGGVSGTVYMYMCTNKAVVYVIKYSII